MCAATDAPPTSSGYYNNQCTTSYASAGACQAAEGVGCVYVEPSVLSANNTIGACAGQPGVNVGSWVYANAGACGSVISTSQSACTAAITSGSYDGCVQMPQQN